MKDFLCDKENMINIWNSSAICCLLAISRVYHAAGRGGKWRERKAVAQTGKTFDITEAEEEEEEANARFALRLFGKGVQWIPVSAMAPIVV